MTPARRVAFLALGLGLPACAVAVFRAHPGWGSPDPLSVSASRPSAALAIGILVFREGLECVLVLAAVFAGKVERAAGVRKPILAGVGMGLAATAVTWMVAVRILNDLGASVPALALQAATGLLAVIVLLVVMNWFFHRFYWTGWIMLHNRRKKKLLEGAPRKEAGRPDAARRGLLWGMGLLGFTASYREGFEVVLFLQGYRLRLGNAPIVWGTAIGLALTTLIAALTLAARRRLPYRKMLVFTGTLLGVVLLVMVGEEAQEMQLAHWIGITTIPALARVLPDWASLWFSVFPNLQALLAQAAAAALVLGSYWAATRADAIRRWRKRNEVAANSATPLTQGEIMRNRSGARATLLLFAVVLALGHGRFGLAQNPAPPSTVPSPDTGILLMAHGGSKDWNDMVRGVASETDREMPTEVALGMADRSTLQAGIDRLNARGVRRIAAVPLFVSSHSSVIESTKYLLGQRPDAPKELADFTMGPEMPGMNGRGGGDGAQTALPRPVTSTVPLRMTPALDRSPIVAAILSDRAAAIARDPEHDVVLLVAHGPNDDAENVEWLADMAALAQEISRHTAYAGVDYVTLRDDADPPIRDSATAELRKHAQAANAAGNHVLVVPLLLSYGGIEDGLRQRLDGIEHTLSPQALLPDARVAPWVLQSARAISTSR